MLACADWKRSAAETCCRGWRCGGRRAPRCRPLGRRPLRQRPAGPGRRVGPGRGAMGRGAKVQGRQAQLRGLDLRRHLRPHRPAIRDRLGREGREHDLLVQRSPDEARHDVCRRREDRCLAVLALLVPELHQGRHGRAARRASRCCRLREGLLGLHEGSRRRRRQAHGAALFRGDLGVELQRRDDAEGRHCAAVLDL